MKKIMMLLIVLILSGTQTVFADEQSPSFITLTDGSIEIKNVNFNVETIQKALNTGVINHSTAIAFIEEIQNNTISQHYTTEYTITTTRWSYFTSERVRALIEGKAEENFTVQIFGPDNVDIHFDIETGYKGTAQVTSTFYTKGTVLILLKKGDTFTYDIACVVTPEKKR